MSVHKYQASLCHFTKDIRDATILRAKKWILYTEITCMHKIFNK